MIPLPLITRSPDQARVQLLCDGPEALAGVLGQNLAILLGSASGSPRALFAASAALVHSLIFRRSSSAKIARKCSSRSDTSEPVSMIASSGSQVSSISWRNVKTCDHVSDDELAGLSRSWLC